ncbi:putative ribosomal protein 11 mitochondrial protein [Rosellinia necatrix]|uniref:Putative ribosomal protein 11 mitochondrial protein n=1 Tax=Rosellinia necatrix TaxID=77044 RepID=A0A1W2TT80_ROSNE|nr:putative ribosomal protein 11 mitochondrial protein [Rosellinia necatrix]
MPPRLNCPVLGSLGRNPFLAPGSRKRTQIIVVQNTISEAAKRRHYATASSLAPLGALRLPDDYIPPTQPPSVRRPELRKAQLLRAYTAMLRSTPVMLFFQHNNLTAVEWAAVRRELRAALAEVPPPVAGPDGVTPVDIAPSIEFQVLRTRMFNVAYKIVEYFKPEAQAEKSNAYAHDLSKTAYETIKNATIDESSNYGQINPLLTGPIAAVTFPSVSPAHLAVALRILSPSPPAFPAPTRKKYPGYHDPVAQSGFQKLILIGGRVEGRTFDNDGVKWVGGIEGGVDGLRVQLVSLLQNAGLGLTMALDGHSKSLWLALESRRTQMEEEANGGKKTGEAENEASA